VGTPLESAMPATSQRPSRRRRRYWIVPAVLLLLAAAIVLPPLININRYHRRIAESISGALGRPVHMSDVKLVMLPRPGFELSDFVVDEDPAFGFEPTLRSATVVASVRLSSLWRGRLEIARIHLEEPSLNLVRNRPGQWNFASVMVQAARTSSAPTVQRHAGGALRFPYIEATDARINFKYGDEKMPFSFLSADLSVWLAEPDEWQLRFEAQPVRTDLDLNLADTGVLKVEGSLHRAPTIDHTPLDLTAEWSGASLGQLSLLLTGYDPGWRGTVDVHAGITGDPENALIKARLHGVGIHRIEFEPDTAVDVEANCEMRYRHGLEAVEGLACLAPVGDGRLLLTGGIEQIATEPRPALALDIQRVPVSALFRAMQLVRAGFPAGIHASGDLDGRFTWNPAEAVPFAGAASIAKLTLDADGLDHPLLFADVALSANTAGSPAPLTIGPPASGPARSPHGAHGVNRVRAQALGLAASGFPDLETGAPSVAMSALSLAAAGDPPLTLSGRFGVGGYELRLSGTVPISRLIKLNRGFDVLPAAVNGLASVGSADLDIAVHGPWLAALPIDPEEVGAVGGEVNSAAELPAETRMDGTVRLRNARITPDFLAAPLEIASADGVFSGDELAWSGLSIGFGPIHADGSVVMPVPCPADCVRHFDLHLASLDAATLQSTLLGARRGQLLEELIGRLSERPRSWPRLEGTLLIDSLSLNRSATGANVAVPGTLTMRDVRATLTAAGNTLTIGTLTAQTLGGSLQAAGTVDAGGDLPAYNLRLNLTGADATQAAALFQERWGSGALNLKTELHLSGFTTAQLAKTASGTFHAEWTGHGGPGHSAAGSSLDGGSTILSHFDSWVADGTISGQRLVLDHSIATPSTPKVRRQRALRRASIAGPTPVPLTGGITFGRVLSLHGNSGAVQLGGTLQHPVAAPAASTTASPSLAHRPR
jgi:hypothetical protein